MSSRVEVFPVEAITVEPYGIREGSRAGKPCRRSGTWYRDTHDAARRSFKHHAQDIFAAPGSPILAPAGGVIVDSSATRGPSPRGGHGVRLVVPDDDNPRRGRAYWMSHLLEAPLVQTGDEVEAGQVLGLLGATGNARTTCPHLHIGARRAWLTTEGEWTFGTALNIYRELRAVDPSTAPARRRPEPSQPMAETPCPCCAGKGVR